MGYLESGVYSNHIEQEDEKMNNLDFERNYKTSNCASNHRFFSSNCGFNLGNYVLLLLLGWVFLLASVASDSFASSPSPAITPVNPEFVAWQSKAAAFTPELRDAEGHSLGLVPSPVDRSHLIDKAGVSKAQLDAAPSSYNLRTLGYVTPVKDQGGCGSCWAFATYGSLESWLLKNKGETWDLSENHLKNYHGFDFTVCVEGGNADMSTAYLARWSGPVSEADDPYHDWDDRPSPGGPCRKYVENVLWFFTASDIKNALMTYGGLHVSMYMDSAYYNSSQYTYYYNGSDATINHGVTLVGWDDNKVVPGAPGNGAWYIKNSWGTGWGDSGFFWISYYDSKAVKYAVAFCDAVSTELYSKKYQYDPFGLTAGLGYSSPTAWAANIFVATANEQLKAVGLYATDNAVSYIIYVYDTFNGSKFTNLLGSVSGTLTNAGYHTIHLDSPINLTTGNDFSIVVKFTTTTGYTYPIPLEMNASGYSSGATASPGQSYISPDGAAFIDITTIPVFNKTNVCIKGLTLLCVSPAITSQPGPPTLTICQGQSQQYCVTATGSGLSYQWQKNSSNISGATSSCYTASQSGTYCCVVSNACGSTTSDCVILTVNPVPSIPTGVSASDGTYCDRVCVSWNSVSGATGYEIWRNTSNNSGSASKIADVSSSPYCDYGVVPGATYYYWIKAKNSCGTSGFSSSDPGSCGAAPPTDVSAGDGIYCDKVQVNWNSISGFTYEIWRNTTNDSDSAGKIADDDASPYDDNSVISGVTYYYWIKARNSCGTSGFSDSDSGYSATAPSASTGLSASYEYMSKVQVKWNAAGGATSYEIWRYTSNDSNLASKIADDTASPYDDTNVEANDIYWYWVKAKNSCGTSAFSDGDSGHITVPHYTAIDLNPSGWSGSEVWGINGTEQVGFGCSLGTGGNYHALLWNGSETYCVDLNPNRFISSYAHGISGAQQVGWGNGPDTGGNYHALLWNGTAASYVDLNPLGFNYSVAWGTSGTKQVGAGNGSVTHNQNHALLWSGTAASRVDLNPGGFSNSVAYGISDTQQVGCGSIYGHYHALLWSGTAASRVDLNPSGWSGSEAWGINGTEQVGFGCGLATGGNYHALLWSGTAASYVDLNPEGVIRSYALGTNGIYQVGYGMGTATDNNDHALLWDGSANDFLDLHQFLPAGFSKSFAYSIDSYGNIVGYATDSLRNEHAILWKLGGCYEPIPADKNGDCKVDFTDFCLFAVGWPDEEDFNNLAALCDSWLDCNLEPPESCWD